MLRTGGVVGTDAELEQAAHDFGLYAFAIKLLATYLYDTPGHKVSNASEIPALDVPEAEGKHPRRVMSVFAKRFGESAEVDLLRILGLFNSPANKEEIAALREAPSIPNLTEHLQGMSDAEWLGLVNKLRRVKLIASESSHRPDTLDAHPLVREHFGKQLKQEHSEAWREGNNRLFVYYTISARALPRTLEEMAPLYAAVMHGCEAGRHREVLNVFSQRILRGKEHFSWKRLGTHGTDLSALASFFDLPWQRPVATLNENEKGFVLNQAGIYLRALGRLAEAEWPMRAALEMVIEYEHLQGSAAIGAGNLCELYWAIGDVGQLLKYARGSIEIADRSGDEFMRVSNRAWFAVGLHLADRLNEAEAAFREAEDVEKNRHATLSILSSVPGFQYCDFLLNQNKYQEVLRRASQTANWAEQVRLDILSSALDGISLGRAHLLQSEYDHNHPIINSLNFLDRALGGLRQAKRLDYLPLGLLARAEYYRVTNDLYKAQRDLDEAFKIAARGGMGLHLADCHLKYAWLNMAKGDKAKARKHWQIAKDSIEKMGYHRRDKEVQELEVSLRGTE